MDHKLKCKKVNHKNCRNKHERILQFNNLTLGPDFLGWYKNIEQNVEAIKEKTTKFDCIKKFYFLHNKELP